MFLRSTSLDSLAEQPAVASTFSCDRNVGVDHGSEQKFSRSSQVRPESPIAGGAALAYEKIAPPFRSDTSDEKLSRPSNSFRSIASEMTVIHPHIRPVATSAGFESVGTRSMWTEHRNSRTSSQKILRADKHLLWQSSP